MQTSFGWVFKLGCLSMLSLLGLGARYGHTGQLSPTSTQQFNKAQFYHFVNTASLFLIAMTGRSSSTPARIATVCFIGGLLMFCGPLYYLAITGEKKPGISKMAPFGGASMLLGWSSLLFL